MNVRVVNERERGFGIIEGERGISSVHSCRFSHFLTPSFSIISDASHPRQFPRLRPFLFLFLSVCLFSLFLLLRPFSVPFRGYGRACSSPELIYYGARLERAPVMLTLLMGNNVCGTRVDKEKEREQETRVRVERVFFLPQLTQLIRRELVLFDRGKCVKTQKCSQLGETYLAEVQNCLASIRLLILSSSNFSLWFLVKQFRVWQGMVISASQVVLSRNSILNFSRNNQISCTHVCVLSDTIGL